MSDCETVVRQIQHAYWNPSLNWDGFGEKVASILILNGLDRRPEEDIPND